MVNQPENKSVNQNKDEKRTFIELARRAQIIEATIDVLAEQGYMNASFVRIAKRAGISAGLISYHFKDKEELMDEVYMTIMGGRLKHLQEKIADGKTATDKLRIALEADMAYMGNQPRLFKALIEGLFSARDSEGHLKYMKDIDEPDINSIATILETGQKNGEFGVFDTYNMALILDGARDQFLAQLPIRPSFNLEKFTKTLVDFALKAVQKEEL
ncbi:MAG: TetR family transcriptional regulator [Chloroflexota bacterium]